MSAPSMQPVLDRELALSRAGGDFELLKEIAILFLAEYPNAMRDIREAIDKGDAKALERTAHGLKGSVANFGAAPAVEAARTLEFMGRAQDIGNAAPVVDALALVLAALDSELQAL